MKSYDFQLLETLIDYTHTKRQFSAVTTSVVGVVVISTVFILFSGLSDPTLSAPS